MVTTSATAQSDSDPSNLPAASANRDTGVSSRLSSVPRSRSPLTVSAADSNASSEPTAIATCRRRFTVSRCSRKFSA
jgi:hypothetical protein